ncbi:FHA domain-containing protein [Myxococcus stipitatus]|uniref:FHA domain-containing protein n=1 Tax=Myxococcus stipitatus TaxID=83455 RepID=UPI00314551F4
MYKNALFTIEDTRSGAVETQRVAFSERHWKREQGIVIGSAEDCDVRVSGPGITAHHARWYTGGHHIFVWVLDEDAVVTSSRGDTYRGGDTLRVDYRPFTLGPYVFNIGFD